MDPRMREDDDQGHVCQRARKLLVAALAQTEFGLRIHALHRRAARDLIRQARRVTQQSCTALER